MIFKAIFVPHSEDFIKNDCIVVHGYELSEKSPNVAICSDKTRICKVIKTETSEGIRGPLDGLVDLYFEVKQFDYVPDNLILIVGNHAIIEILNGEFKGRSIKFSVEEVKDESI